MKQCSTAVRGEFTVVVLGGEVDLSWSQQVRRAVLDALAESDAVAVDLGEVTYVDSSAIAALVEGFQSARGRGKRFVLLGPSPQVLAVLKLARLDKVFRIVPSLEQVGS